jgi:Family of unknown function (DUF6988)
MNEIDREILRSSRINQQIAELRERHGYLQNRKNDLLMAYFDIISEHHKAIGLLIKENLVGSSFALVRPIAETLYRAAWVNACATAQELERLFVDDNFHFPPDMIEKIDTAYSAGDFFKHLKHDTWKSMCGYTHSGSHQINRRFGEDGYVGPNYSDAETMEALRATTAMLILIAILFFKSTGCADEASEVEKIGLMAETN